MESIRKQLDDLAVYTQHSFLYMWIRQCVQTKQYRMYLPALVIINVRYKKWAIIDYSNVMIFIIPENWDC